MSVFRRLLPCQISKQYPVKPCTLVSEISKLFFHIEAPAHLRRFFGLPKISARHLKLTHLGGTPIGPGTLITPVFKVLPMRWKWSLWIAQAAHEFLAEQHGLDAERRILDRNTPPSMSKSCVAHAQYVDNYLCASHNPTNVAKDSNVHETSLEQVGLPCHEVETGISCVTFAGLELDGQLLTARVTWNRIWRDYFCITYVLTLSEIDGSALESIVGHITWCMLVRRGSLSLINACNEFIRLHRPHKAPLWDSVKRELRWVRGLLPFLFSKLDLPWSCLLTATDASGAPGQSGWGVCEMPCSSSTVGAVGRVSERWRYDTEDAVQARANSLGLSAAVQLDTQELEDIGRGFFEVPARFLKSNPNWKVEGREERRVLF